MGEAVHVWGQRAYGRSLYLALNFAVTKSALKNSLTFLFAFPKQSSKDSLISHHCFPEPRARDCCIGLLQHASLPGVNLRQPSKVP